MQVERLSVLTPAYAYGTGMSPTVIGQYTRSLTYRPALAWRNDKSPHLTFPQFARITLERLLNISAMMNQSGPRLLCVALWPITSKKE